MGDHFWNFALGVICILMKLESSFEIMIFSISNFLPGNFIIYIKFEWKKSFKFPWVRLDFQLNFYVIFGNLIHGFWNHFYKYDDFELICNLTLFLTGFFIKFSNHEFSCFSVNFCLIHILLVLQRWCQLLQNIDLVVSSF